MTYLITSPQIGMQRIADTSTSATTGKQHPLGTIVRAKDPTYGEGEFIYLEGVASTVVGSTVVYDTVNGTTTLAPNTANMGRPIAIAMSANVANSYGWYQIAGAAVIKKSAVVFSPNVALFLSGTAGRVRASVASGKQVLNARTINAATVSAAVSTITVQINRPFTQGQVI